MAELNFNYHPFYNDWIYEWEKFRIVFDGGINFVNSYLYKYSDAETDNDFALRKKLTYRPNHAKRAILKIRDALYQRMADVKRTGGPKSYIAAVAGLQNGINRKGMPLGTFIMLKVVPELLSMGRAFVYVDKKPLPKSFDGITTVKDAAGKVPYITFFAAEDVLNWVYGDPDSKHEYVSVLLREWAFNYDKVTGLPIGQYQRFRRLFVDDTDKVFCQFYNDKFEPGETVPLELDRIPLVRFEIAQSLMQDVADYQVALLNLVSTDMSYLTQSNTGIYVEQYDPKWEGSYVREGQPNQVAAIDIKDANGNIVTPAGTGSATGTVQQANAAANRKILLGNRNARRVPQGTLMPEFISPSTDPVIASMKKQDQLIAEIERLVNLQVENLSITGEAVKQERASLESGLSTIGAVLETGENQLADFWAQYEGGERALVNYPRDYSLKTDTDRIKESNDLIPLKTAVPSTSFAKEVSKKIASTMFDGKVTPDIMAAINKEIDDADFTTSDPDTLATCHQEGAITAAMMAKALGFKNPDKLALDAQAEQATRLATIAIHQQKAAGARGVADMQNGPGDGKNEKLVAKQKPAPDQKTQKE